MHDKKHIIITPFFVNVLVVTRNKTYLFWPEIIGKILIFFEVVFIGCEWNSKKTFFITCFGFRIECTKLNTLLPNRDNVSKLAPISSLIQLHSSNADEIKTQ